MVSRSKHSYTLTLAPTTTGAFQLSGWTNQPIAGDSGGSYQIMNVTVTN